MRHRLEYHLPYTTHLLLSTVAILLMLLTYQSLKFGPRPHPDRRAEKCEKVK